MFELRPYLLGGARASNDLRSAAGVTRDTVANAYHRECTHILRLGRARATRYAARQKITGLETDEFPVFRVDKAGKIAPAGQLITLAASESVWLPDESIVDGLPPEMHDAAPRGFLGRSYARRHAALGLPDNVNSWSDNHILIALSRRGEDLTGNLVVGRESFDRYQRLQYIETTQDDFQRLSEEAIAGEHVGSSAGGEQSKFTALIGGMHRIIKFATNATDNARRWQDLLALEHAALQTLHLAGIDAAKTQLIDVDGLRCLVIDRFDRIGVRGRRAVVTLAAISPRIDSNWTDAAEILHRSGMLGVESFRRVALLDAFGALIANTDRHQHNVVLFPSDAGFSVAPAFDQLPMAYAPPASGNLQNTAIAKANPASSTLVVWDDATRLAQEFWRRAGELTLSGTMQAIVREHIRQLS